MVKCGDMVELRDGEDVLARVKKQLAGRIGTVIAAWEPVNGHPSFWEQCTVQFDAQGRKREVTLDLMFEWIKKV